MTTWRSSPKWAFQRLGSPTRIMRINHQIRFGRPYSNGESKRRHGRIAHGSNYHLFTAKPFSPVSSTVVIVAIDHGNWIMVYVSTLHIRIFMIDSRKSPGIRLITTFNPHDRPRTLLLPAYTRYVDFFGKIMREIGLLTSTRRYGLPEPE